VEWSSFLTILKQSGPTIAVLIGIVWLQWRHIDRLLQKNSSIYDEHIKALYQTQDRLLTNAIGPQTSSRESPTMKQLKEVVTATNKGETADGGSK